MGSPVPLWIPCEVFDVVLSAENDGPTDLEKALLLFLAARPGSRLNDILDFLCLGERMAMDLITDLWQAGYVVVDAIQGSVTLEDYWRDRVLDDFTGVLSAQRLSDTCHLMRDLVSGQIFEDIASPATPLPGSAAPVLVASSLDEGVTQAGLAAIAMKALRPGSPLRARTRSVRAEIAARPGGGRGLGWLRIDFEAKVDPHVPGSLTLRPAPSDDIVRARLGPGVARALTAWALDNPEHPAVVKLLDEAVTEGIRHGAGLVGRIEALADHVVGAMAAPKDHLADAVRWRAEIAALTTEVEALEAAHGKIVLRTGAEAEPAAVLRLAADFEHQLVLAAPTLDYDGLLSLSETVVARLKALPVDASAVVLWGGRGQRQLPERAVSYLGRTGRETAASGAQRFLSSPRASRIAAALAVIDGRRILYASSSPLEAGAGDDAAGEGALFTYVLDISAEAPSPIPRRALEFARQRAPDFAIADQIDLKPWVEVASPQKAERFVAAMADDPSDRAAGGSAGDDASEGRVENTDADNPARETGEDADEILSLTASLHDLSQMCRVLAARAAQAGSTVDILADGALYQQALDLAADEEPLSQEATLWLGFGRDDATSGGVPLHQTMTEAVEERVRRGLHTVVLLAPPVHRKVESGAKKDAVVSPGVEITALRELSTKSPGLVAILETPGLVGHFLCGEARFLAAPGGLASPPVTQVGRLSSCLVGVAVSDPDLCAAFRTALAAHWPQLKSHLAIASPRHRPAPTVGSVALTGLVETWRAARPGKKRGALLEAIRARQADGGLTAAKALLNMTVGRQDTSARNLRRDVLSLVAAQGDWALAASARAELAVTAWRERRWQEAAVILAAEGVDSATCPFPPELAAAAAAVDVGLVAPDLSSVLCRDDEDGWLAGVALASKAVLFNGDHDLAASLEIKISDPVPTTAAHPVEAVARAVFEYWSATMQPVDSATILAIARRDELEDDLRAAAGAFADSFRTVAAREYNNAMLGRVVPRVYSDVSGFKPVAGLIGPGGAATSWAAVLNGLTAAIGEGRVNVSDLADDFFEKARQRFGLATDEKVAKGRGKGAGIHETAHEVIRLAVNLRDTIQVAQEAPTRAASPAMKSLLMVLRAQAPALANLATTRPPTSIAAPILVDFNDRLTNMIGAKS